MIRNGTRTIEQMKIPKLPSAQASPPRSCTAIVPKPWARYDDRLGCAVIEFHSLMSRSHRAAPDELVGEMEPNVASWRAPHGPMTTRNATAARTPAKTEIGGGGATRG